jgi:calcineurin-like phosphoesterase family protein
MIQTITDGFITSDPHYFHQNILKYQADTRPYGSVVEMNEVLIERHNATVSPHDHVWFVGDFSFGKLQETRNVLRRLNGIKHLVLGNHDMLITKNLAEFTQSTSDHSTFASVDTYKELKFKHTDGEEYFLCLFHYPILEFNRGHHGSMMLHGHSHGHCKYPWATPRRIMDIGVDCHPNNAPFSFAEVVDNLKQRPVIKHH